MEKINFQTTQDLSNMFTNIFLLLPYGEYKIQK